MLKLLHRRNIKSSLILRVKEFTMKKLLLSSVVLLSTVFITACSQNQENSNAKDDDVEMTSSSTSKEESSTSTSTSSSQTTTPSEPFNPEDYTTVDFAVWNHDEIEKGKKYYFQWESSSKSKTGRILFVTYCYR